MVPLRYCHSHPILRVLDELGGGSDRPSRRGLGRRGRPFRKDRGPLGITPSTGVVGFLGRIVTEGGRTGLSLRPFPLAHRSMKVGKATSRDIGRARNIVVI